MPLFIGAQKTAQKKGSCMSVVRLNLMGVPETMVCKILVFYVSLCPLSAGSSAELDCCPGTDML